jgi:hypothetical protein
MEYLEDVWDAILSRQPDLIWQSYNNLDRASQKVVITHLHRMVSEPDWHPEQQVSAKTALEVLETGNSVETDK